LKFLLDVNVGTTIAEALTEAGHEVVRVQLLTPRERDEQILAWAVRENRILVSYDSDFTDLIYRDRMAPPPAILYIRFEPPDLALLALRIVELARNELLFGHMVVIGPVETRMRPFPGRETND
jgi:predicted nuclease of predicted toxin-antitoxin system